MFVTFVVVLEALRRPTSSTFKERLFVWNFQMSSRHFEVKSKNLGVVFIISSTFCMEKLMQRSPSLWYSHHHA